MIKYASVLYKLATYVHAFFYIAPTLTVRLSPPLIIGDSREDVIKLLCTAMVAEDVLSATYQFAWIKDDTPIDLSDNRIMVGLEYPITVKAS